MIEYNSIIIPLNNLITQIKAQQQYRDYKHVTGYIKQSMPVRECIILDTAEELLRLVKLEN